jgi:lipoyl(octanoyl) transferase
MRRFPCIGGALGGHRTAADALVSRILVPREMSMNPISRRDDLDSSFRAEPGGSPVEWVVEPGLVAYPDALAEMESRVAAISEGRARERVWLIEHPPLYTAGTSADPADLVAPDRFPVFATGRGGQYTYHGPGQRVAYVMLDMKRRRQDVRAYVSALEAWLIGTLQHFNIRGERREDRVGVWVRRPERGGDAEDKIAAIGIRVRRWVTFHGVSLNVDPDLEHFSGIVPCGVKDHGVTSLVDLGLPVAMTDADIALRAAFEDVFGETVSGTV